MTMIVKAVDEIDYDGLLKAAEILRAGGLVAFPTETVYGLGANAFLGEAVVKIFVAKGRPQDNPLIVHVSSMEMLDECAEVPDERIYKVMEELWPGPLTVVLPKREGIPDQVTAGLNTVGIRMPDNKIALELIRLAGVPVAAPSANISGKPSPTEARHVIDDLFGKVDVIIDGGKCSFGLESTVVDFSGGKPLILRPGAVSFSVLKKFFAEVEYDPAIIKGSNIEVPKAPGMKYRHYAPEAGIIVVKGDTDKRIKKIKEIKRDLEAKGCQVGILCFYENAGYFEGKYRIILGSIFDYEECGRNLFSAFRSFDELGVDYIICEWENLGTDYIALENRLFKASAGNVIEVL